MLKFILPFYGIKEIILKKGNIIINILAIFIAIILYISYYVGMILLFSYLFDKDNFGLIPICNKIKDRALIINGFTFPLCYRCLSITLMIFLFLPFFMFGISKYYKSFFIIAIIFLLIGLIDGILQYGFNIMSNNIRRIITGGIAGIGISYVLAYFLQLFFKKFKI